VRRALGAGLKAVAGESWLAALGMAVALSRGALALPATAFAAALSWIALRAALLGGSAPADALVASMAALAAPRARSIALGLWFAGLLLFGALRAAWMAGALAALARRLCGERPPRPAFAAGVAYRFGRVAAGGLLALLVDLAGVAMVAACAFSALALVPLARESAAPWVLAAGAAAALAGSLFLAASLSVVGDVLLARVAMAGDAPGPALARALVAYGQRPAAFLVASLVVSLAGVLAAGSVESFFGVLASATAGAPRVLLLAPQVLLAGLTALLAAGAELWRLAAVGSLALAGDGG